MSWEFWIDRGGTFTDCIGVSPDGELHTAKLLSSDAAPVEGIRRILERAGVVAAGESFPPCRVKLGTTLATNALLERRGVPTALVANRGLADVFEIGTQEREDLFSLCVEKPAPLQQLALEVAGRVDVAGAQLEPFDEPAARAVLEGARRAGVRAVAIALIHAYAHPEVERRLRDLAAALGFEHVVVSHEVAREQGLLARGQTACVDAYLTPLLRGHVAALREALPGARLRFMQSSGGLTDAERFRGPTALLSGPAGGVVGAARVAALAGCARAVGFDMGGTSTDVSLVEGDRMERSFETLVGGVRVRAPMLRIHTVAAGGGSLCRFDGFRFTVGPESAGADPGPLCYGHPAARELALTDVNLALGRVQSDRFPFPLEMEPVRRALARMGEVLRAEGHELDAEAIAAGFVEVANASMAQAITQVSTARGVDPRDCALVGFGGAAGQHVCAIARALGMRRVVLHPFAGILSAYGIGVADASWDGQRDAGRVPLASGSGDGVLPEAVREALSALEHAGREALEREGATAHALQVERRLDLRYAGTETPLSILEPARGDWSAAFAEEHRARFGYARPGRAVEIVTARVRIFARAAAAPTPAEGLGRGGADPRPLRRERVWFHGAGRLEAPVYAREEIGPGAVLEGPALILEDTGTVVLDPGFRLGVGAENTLMLTDEAGPSRPARVDLTRVDPIRLEVLGNRFMSIAEQMGAVLRNTSVSTNIKERLDYSCAVFGRRHQRSVRRGLAPPRRDAGDPRLHGRCGPRLLRGEPRAPRRHRRRDAGLDAGGLAPPRGGGRVAGAVRGGAGRSLRRDGTARAAHARALSGAQPGRQRGGVRGDGGGQPLRRRPADRVGGRAGRGGGRRDHAAAAAGRRWQGAPRDRAPERRRTRVSRWPGRRHAAVRLARRGRRTHAHRFRRNRARRGGQPERAARCGAGRRDLRAARARRRAHSAERGLPRAGRYPDPLRLVARSAARLRRGRRQRGDFAAGGGRVARSHRSRGREPGDHEQRGVR
jgi:5-oxoprolinase (ATP-hydrolysing)